MWDQLEGTIKHWMQAEELNRTESWDRGYLVALRMVLEEMKRLENEARIEDAFK